MSLRKRNIDVIVEDILCVPDYMQFMQPYIDPNLARCDKEKWTELQWTFESVERSELYPHGVKVTYRKFSAPEVFLIHELKKPKERPMPQNGEENVGEEKEADKESTEEKLWNDASPEAREFGFGWRKYKVNTHPVVEKPGDTDGMYLLQSLPDGKRQFQPQPFVRDSRKELEKLVALTIRKFGKVPRVRGEWEAWKDFKTPQPDDVLEYCREKSLEIPLWDKLFYESPVIQLHLYKQTNQTKRATHRLSLRLLTRFCKVIGADEVSIREMIIKHDFINFSLECRQECEAL